MSSTPTSRATAAPYAALLDALRGVRWPARSLSRTARTGLHRARVRGTAAEFSEYRPYRQGDDVRRLDWKLLARTDRAYIRLSDERSVYATTVVLDASGSMAYPVTGAGKWDAGRALAVGCAAVALAGGDPAGLALASVALPPRARQGALGDIVRTVDALAPAGAAPLAPVMAAAARGAQRLVLVSDFLGDELALFATARELAAAGAEVYALHVIAPEEIDPPASLALAVDPEDPSVMRPLDAPARAAYARAFTTWREDVRERWRRSGATYMDVIVGRDAPAGVIRRLAMSDAGVAARDASSA